ncbi:MAG: hypothetical protein ACRCYY_02405 [Trueperaceae bacterium]
MRIGFIRQLLWEHYGEFWVSLLTDIGADIHYGDPEAVYTFHQYEHVRAIPGLNFQFAVAESLALTHTDLLVVPYLNGTGKLSSRGSGQDPWIANFPSALARLGGLPPLLKVPVTLSSDLEPLVLETLLSLKRDPAKVRLTWERHRNKTQSKRYSEPRWTTLPGQQQVAGVVGQAWLLETCLPALQFPDAHLVTQLQFSPEALRDEALRLEKRLVPSDADVLGAAHFFGRKGNIDKLLYLADKTSGIDSWLQKQLVKFTSKELEVLYIQDLFSEKELTKIFLGVGKNPTSE